MKVEVSVEIAASPEEVWKVISDIENSANVISGILEIEVLEQGGEDLVGFKWKETRKCMGKVATEVIWITEAVANEFYETRAESHGCIYIARVAIEPKGEQSILSMSLSGEALTVLAKVMSALMGWLFKGACRKAMATDLGEIKAAVESAGA